MTDTFEFGLLNDYQRDFPLIARPFEEIGRRLGIAESSVIEALQRLSDRGAVSRVGAVFKPGCLGASTLAAMALPQSELERVAHMVSAFPEVNHNYEREHRFNLWFVITAHDKDRLHEVLRAIEKESGYPVISLPLLQDYHIDLGFDLRHADESRYVTPPGGSTVSDEGIRAPIRVVPSSSEPTTRGSPPLEASEAALVGVLQSGLPLTTRPYREIGRDAGLSEGKVMATVRRWLGSGVVKRFGVIVRHRELGYSANAMVVWDVPDRDVDHIGRCLAQSEAVTLCYRRARSADRWPFNLYCMVHGKSYTGVLSHVQQLRMCCTLRTCRYAVLFSRRCFKQRGAQYVQAASMAYG